MHTGEWDAPISLDFGIQMDHLILARRPNLVTVKKKNRTRWIVDFTVAADYRLKLKGSKQRNKYLSIARELKKKWNMGVMVVPIVIGALGTETKGLIQGPGDFEIRERTGTIQTTTFFRLDIILRRILKTWGNLLSLKLQWETIS